MGAAILPEVEGADTNTSSKAFNKHGMRNLKLSLDVLGKHVLTMKRTLENISMRLYSNKTCLNAFSLHFSLPSPVAMHPAG